MLVHPVSLALFPRTTATLWYLSPHLLARLLQQAAAVPEEETYEVRAGVLEGASAFGRGIL
jgi:hypothetical protein